MRRFCGILVLVLTYLFAVHEVHTMNVQNRNTAFLDLATDEILSPDSDGLPMAENTKQYNLITMLHSRIDALFAEEDGFCAADYFGIRLKNIWKYALRQM